MTVFAGIIMALAALSASRHAWSLASRSRDPTVTPGFRAAEAAPGVDTAGMKILPEFRVVGSIPCQTFVRHPYRFHLRRQHPLIESKSVASVTIMSGTFSAESTITPLTLSRFQATSRALRRPPICAAVPRRPPS